MANVSFEDEFEMGQPTEDGKIEFVAEEFDVESYGQVVSKTFSYKGDSWKLEAWSCECRRQKVDVIVHLELITKASLNATTAQIRCEDDPEQLCYKDVLANSGEFMLAMFSFEEDFPFEDLKLEIQLVPIDTQGSLSTFATDLLNRFETEDFGDVSIVANDGKKFRCHRDILAPRSDVFAGMFSSGMKEERENLVDIKDFNGEIVAQLLLYIYTDKCQVEKISDRLYAAADKYQLDGLKVQCETVLAANLSAKSVVKTYRLATFYRLDQLKAKCVEYLDSHKADMSVADLLDESMEIQEGNEGQLDQQ